MCVSVSVAVSECLCLLCVCTSLGSLLPGMNVGFYFVTLANGLWYLFNREYFFAPQPSYCLADFAQLLVRQSSDQGATWSAPSVVISPVPNSPYGTRPCGSSLCSCITASLHHCVIASLHRVVIVGHPPYTPQHGPH